MAESFRAEIPPVPAGEPRPLWSVMIPTFNCADYLRRTLASVLAQDPGPEAMQIEVVDDRSTADDPEAVVREVGGGRVAFHRQPRNVGHVGNFETCLLRSRGRLVHLLHGDDAVRPGFYAAMGRAWDARPDVGMAFCRNAFVDERGHWASFSRAERAEPGVLEGWLGTIAAGQRIQTPAVVVRREVYERLGGFDRRLSWSEDWEMWVRIAAHHPVWFEPEVLAEYRVHGGSSSGRHLRTGENVRDLTRAIEVIRASLPDEVAARAIPRATEWCARGAVRAAFNAARAGDPEAARAQLREAWRTRPSAGTAAAIARFAAWAAARALAGGVAPGKRIPSAGTASPAVDSPRPRRASRVG